MLGKTALGKYRIMRPLGRGSNAEVFLAEPIRHGPQVVVKRIHDHVVSHHKFRQLFDAEVRSMRNFCHPYAVEFLEADIDDPLGPCLVMEYVPGITLEALLAKNRIIDLDRVGRLLGYLCHALQAAHDTGIFHRDLKPANLMVVRAGSTNESLKVMDFGFAGFAAKPHFQLAELTGAGSIHAMGTPGYVSPEMIRGDTVDRRSDLYSVGVILFELLTGKLPFDFDRMEKILQAHIKQPPPRFASLGVHDVPAAVENVVQLTLSKYPNERPQCGRDLAIAFGRATGREIWEKSAPVGWEPVPTAVTFTPPAREAPALADNPYQIVHEFVATMPERMAAAKLRGFVEDFGGEVLASEPGLIRMRLGVPEGYKEQTGGSAIFSWFRSKSRPTVASGQEPIELELQMEKPDPARPRLAVVVSFRPMKEYLPASVSIWQQRCDKLNATLRLYLARKIPRVAIRRTVSGGVRTLPVGQSRPAREPPMKRIGILTAGGDTPALNATIHGAVTRACQRKVEVIGFIKGFSSLFNSRVPHVHLNPLYSPIPELDPTLGGSLIGASRDYVNADDRSGIEQITDRLRRLSVEGLVCIGGDGTLNGMQALCECLPAVLAPKTIDNDLGLNYRNEADEWVRHPEGTNVPGATEKSGFPYTRARSTARFDLDQMVNYITPGYATAVFVSASGVQRIRSTAESHRRIAIVEVMGRHSGFLALGAAYGQPDILLVPEHRLNLELLVERIKEVYSLQKHCVIVCGEGIVDENGEDLGAEHASTDPAGNVVLSGASESLRALLIRRLGDDYFTTKRRNESARAAIFTRKLGHTQRGGRPILFDRFHAAQLGGHAVDMLLQGMINSVSILQYSREGGFHLGEVSANDFRDRWGLIHARLMHPGFYDPIGMRPSQTGIDYLVPIFTRAVGADDVEVLRSELFDPSHLKMPFHSVNTDVNKRIRYLE